MNAGFPVTLRKITVIIACLPLFAAAIPVSVIAWSIAGKKAEDWVKEKMTQVSKSKKKTLAAKAVIWSLGIACWAILCMILA